MWPCRRLFVPGSGRLHAIRHSIPLPFRGRCYHYTICPKQNAIKTAAPSRRPPLSSRKCQSFRAGISRALNGVCFPRFPYAQHGFGWQRRAASNKIENLFTQNNSSVSLSHYRKDWRREGVLGVFGEWEMKRSVSNN